MSIQIKHCKSEDLKDCSKLMAEVYGAPPYCEKWDINDAYSYLNKFLKIDSKGCLLAHDRSTLIGALFCYSYPWHKEKLTYIQELFVSLEYRRKGVASMLLDYLNDKDTCKVWLIANEKSEAFQFYKAKGLAEVGDYKLISGKINNSGLLANADNQGSVPQAHK
ncbi:hypothetical protein BMR07_18055 [Methylococcaceae bacterium CS1]|nr:hypothetical protein BMR10_16960 [Methylococcaceae bacterium CS4]TXK93209.1 hypothetical protein BMR11_17305 [Methylococcaceae bacterium CS5]TXL02313.1 hypothetical protein BMR07_18055 [Methylococcaceae bacterium CS1]TXL02461.1 hypothetical protein BMR09_16850 [Methylococcaceae bacterium CS3]TXL02929.1 hypothetical protein BMR08_17665 [Methylococcaceae bacterium CS2]TXL12348.1 hypothetical protein BMR04_15705 [Methylococcaceae bacterium HT3]